LVVLNYPVMADLSKAERSDLRIPLYPTGTLFGDVWLSCVNDGTFVLNPQKMLKMLESRLECDNRQHPFFGFETGAVHHVANTRVQSSRLRVPGQDWCDVSSQK
jgi:hypothetical protein